MQKHPSRESSKEASSAPGTDLPGDGIADSDMDLLMMAYREAVQARLAGGVGAKDSRPEPTVADDEKSGVADRCPLTRTASGWIHKPEDPT